MFFYDVTVRRRCVRDKAKYQISLSVVITIVVILYVKSNEERMYLSNIGLGLGTEESQKVSAEIGDKLMEAEADWLKKNLVRSKHEAELKSDGDLLALANSPWKSRFWEFFDPTFKCPYSVERVGRKIGDGGKWVCGFEELIKKPNCVVYSFGIHHESTFEEDIAKRTKCTVHMFELDQKIAAPKWSKEFPGRVTFTKLGVGPENKEDMRTLKTFMDANGDDFADILKIDVEGWEWRVLERVLSDYPNKLPFGQMQIEVHIHHFKPKDQYVAMRNFWYSVEKVGLRTFYMEPNQPRFREFSFLNIRSSMFKLKEDINSEQLKWTLDPKYQRSTTDFLFI